MLSRLGDCLTNAMQQDKKRARYHYLEVRAHRVLPVWENAFAPAHSLSLGLCLPQNSKQIWLEFSDFVLPWLVNLEVTFYVACDMNLYFESRYEHSHSVRDNGIRHHLRL
jgi:hypothetical protein